MPKHNTGSLCSNQLAASHSFQGSFFLENHQHQESFHLLKNMFYFPLWVSKGNLWREICSFFPGGRKHKRKPMGALLAGLSLHTAPEAAGGWGRGPCGSALDETSREATVAMKGPSQGRKCCPFLGDARCVRKLLLGLRTHLTFSILDPGSGTQLISSLWGLMALGSHMFS